MDEKFSNEKNEVQQKYDRLFFKATTKKEKIKTQFEKIENQNSEIKKFEQQTKNSENLFQFLENYFLVFLKVDFVNWHFFVHLFQNCLLFAKNSCFFLLELQITLNNSLNQILFNKINFLEEIKLIITDLSDKFESFCSDFSVNIQSASFDFNSSKNELNLKMIQLISIQV